MRRIKLQQPHLLVTISCFLYVVHGLSPLMRPEQVVEMQLQALSQSDIPTALQYASPESKNVLGSSQRFAELLSSPTFDPIVAHSKANVLMTISHGKESDYTTCCLVGGDSNHECFMVDAILPEFEDMDFDEVALEEADDTFLTFFDVE